MNAEIKALWIADLLANGDKQGKEALRIGDTYCCLGRLCELHRTLTGAGEWVGEGVIYYYHVEDSTGGHILPHGIRDWAELDDSNPAVRGSTRLGSLNDDGFTFAQIAKIIEEAL